MIKRIKKWFTRNKKKTVQPLKGLGQVLDVEETPKGLLVTFFLDTAEFEKMMRRVLER